MIAYSYNNFLEQLLPGKGTGQMWELPIVRLSRYVSCLPSLLYKDVNIEMPIYV